MPEGHTLHRLAKVHHKHFAGKTIAVSSPQGRFVDGAALVDGKKFIRADAWGKHLFHRYEAGTIVHVHLGLYGRFSESAVPMAEPVGQVRMRMVGPDFGTDLRGPTACEVVNKAEIDAIVDRLGPDPLRRNADPDRAWERIRKSHRPIGALLMDQAVVAGIGNVYRAELLFRQRVSPFREGAAVDRDVWDEMWADLVALMRVGLRRGKIVTVDRTHDLGEPSYRKGRPRTYVYRRAGSPCRLCGTTIVHAEMEARNLFWCPNCQAD